MYSKPGGLHVRRTGHWLPRDHTVLRNWVAHLIKVVDSSEAELDPVLQDFADLVDGDPSLRGLAELMFLQVPLTPPYNMKPTGLQAQVRDFAHRLQLFNHVLRQAPQWFETVQIKMGLIGFPLNAIVDWPMGTAASCTFFLDKVVNAQLKLTLNKWSKFLQTSASAAAMNTVNGWFCADALDALVIKGNDNSTKYTFQQLYVCPDLLAPPYGFTSWANFFILLREFLLGFHEPGRAGFCSPNNSQAYVAEVATRALVFIQADNPDIGLMCCIYIGMCKVSTCDLTVSLKQHVGPYDDRDEPNSPVNSKLAAVVSTQMK